MSSAHMMTSFVFPHVDFSLEWMAPAGVHRVELFPFTKCHLSLLPHRHSRRTLVRFQCLVNYPYKQAKCLISLAGSSHFHYETRIICSTDALPVKVIGIFFLSYVFFLLRHSFLHSCPCLLQQPNLSVLG